MQAFAGLHDAGLDHFGVELAHRRDQSVLGITPASESLLAFTIAVNRITALRLIPISTGPCTDAHQQDDWGFAEPTIRVELFKG
jgi:hypothetical protein